MGSASVQDICELSPLQRGMLLHSVYDGATDMYLGQHVYTIVGPLDGDALIGAWQFRPDIFRRHFRSAVGSSSAGVIVPIITGGALGWVLSRDDTFFEANITSWQAALFVGAAMAITAFPMLARIIYENRLSGTPTGTVALACAAAAGLSPVVVASAATGAGWRSSDGCSPSRVC